MAVNDVHLLGITTDPNDVTQNVKLWHTIRHADGTWQPAFGDVKAQESNDPGPFSHIGCAAGAHDDLHCVSTVDPDFATVLWYTERNANGTWDPSFVSVAVNPVSNPGGLTDISCAADAAGNLHVVTVQAIQALPIWHITRYGVDSVDSFGQPIAAGSWDPGWDESSGTPSIYRVRCAANANGDLHVVGLQDNDVWYATRLKRDQFWQSWEVVNPHPQGDPSNGGFNSHSCAVDAAGFLHVIARQSFGQAPHGEGTLWHIIRTPPPGGERYGGPKGTWPPFFESVNAQIANTPGPFVDVSCTLNALGDLHVVAISNGVLWHTIRYANGTWQPWGNVNAQESNDPGFFRAVSIAAIRAE